jgi:ABC-type branched-subunit amino acid transport system permease subunit
LIHGSQGDDELHGESLGHFAVVGVGAYLTCRLVPTGERSPPCSSPPVGSATRSWSSSACPLRVRGLSLAVISLGFAVIASGSLFHQSWFIAKNQFGARVTPIPIASGAGKLADESAQPAALTGP